MGNSKETIVVTGGAGFIGSNLARILLSEGYHVRILDNLSGGTLDNIPKGADFHPTDVRDPRIGRWLEGASTVFHLAAKSSLNDCLEAPAEATEVNVAGTANVVEAAARARVSHIVFADTAAEYEGVAVYPSVPSQACPRSVYGCSKRAAAITGESIARVNGIPFTTLRYFNVYGPAQDWRRVAAPVVSSFTFRLLRNQPARIFGNGQQRRDFIHVDDINAFHLLLLRNPTIRGEVYNLGSGQETTVYDVYRLIENEIRTGLPPEFHAAVPGDAERSCADISGTLDTGWAPQVSLEEGIRSYVEDSCQRLADASLVAA